MREKKAIWLTKSQQKKVLSLMKLAEARARRFIKSVANKAHSDDFFSDAYIAICKAVATHNPDSTNPDMRELHIYADKCISNALIDCLRKQRPYGYKSEKVFPSVGYLGSTDIEIEAKPYDESENIEFEPWDLSDFEPAPRLSG